MNFCIKLTQKGYFQTKRKENYHQILHIQMNLYSKFQPQETILIFGTNFKKNVYFQSKRQKYWILLKTLLNSSYLPRKGFSGLKQKKWAPHNFYIILHIKISLEQNFSSNWQSLFFGSNLLTKVLPVKNYEKVNIIIEFGIFK